GKTQRGMAEIEIERVAEYAVEDAVIAWQLSERIESDLKREGLWDLYWDLERPLIGILAEMEWTGIKVDVPQLQDQSRRLGNRLEVLRGEIYELAGREFNIDSPIQLREILFTDLKLPVIKKTKTGASTDQEVLEQLAISHPLPAKLIEHRQLTKLKGTYLDALPTMVNPETGRIHASFNQVVAATGRLSSSDPNLQNIPIRTEEGKLVRRAFIPGEPDWKLVCADYSQIELRMLAHFCHDEALMSAFAEGIDIHTAVAAQINGVDPRDVTSEMRRIAKAVNFGVIYGQSPYGLAAALQIPQEAAAIFISDYFTKYAGVAKFIAEVLDKCARNGFVETIKGRRRSITGVRSGGDGRQQLNLPERTAVNTVIQGSAADLIKLAMIRVDQKLKKSKHPGRMLLQIHDELVFETPKNRVSDLIKLVREEMEHALQLDVPLKVDVAVGDDWLNTTSPEELETPVSRQGLLFGDE
ncbi:MAG: DNA polymerase I, partial [Planctomycetaceae bacterium]|nr:DNA polymerase I [Planctomycetaceae bacterium]